MLPEEVVAAVEGEDGPDVWSYPYGLPPRLARQLSERVAQIVRSGFRQLTAREVEVLAYAALLGRSSEDVARDLAISPLTVKRHLHNARKQLGMSADAPRRAYGPIVYALGYLSGAMDALHHEHDGDTSRVS